MNGEWHRRLDPLEDAINGHRHDDRDSTRVAAEPESVGTLMRQAPAHEVALAMPLHPSPRRLAGMQAWVEACVKSVSYMRGRTTDAAEAAWTENITARLASVADAFSLYMRTLQVSRAAQQATGVSPPASRTLAEVAEEERLLLAYRSALRQSLHDLISVVAAAD